MKFGVIYSEQHYTPGDERSRTNPGHGYGESWDTITKFKEFKDKDELDSWVKKNYRQPNSWGPQKQDFTIIEFNEIAIELKVETTVKLG